VVASSTTVSAFLVSTDADNAAMLILAKFVQLLFFFKSTPVSPDVDPDSIRTDSSALLAQKDALLVALLISALSVELEDFHTTVSVTSTVLLAQLPALPTTLVLSATLLALHALSTLANA